jgi:hypothetical protein
VPVEILELSRSETKESMVATSQVINTVRHLLIVLKISLCTQVACTIFGTR